MEWEIHAWFSSCLRFLVSPPSSAVSGRKWPNQGSNMAKKRLNFSRSEATNRAQSFLLHWKSKECGSCCLSEWCVSRAILHHPQFFLTRAHLTTSDKTTTYGHHRSLSLPILLSSASRPHQTDVWNNYKSVPKHYLIDLKKASGPNSFYDNERLGVSKLTS